MKIFDWWRVAKGFLAGGFTFIGDGISRLKTAVEWLTNFRFARFAALAVVAKSLYDFCISQINSVLESFNLINLDSLSGSYDFASSLSFANSIIPITETFACLALLLNLWITCTISKSVLKLLSVTASAMPGL